MPTTAAGRQRILDDTSFMAASLCTLRGVDSVHLQLDQVMRAYICGDSSSSTSDQIEASAAGATSHSESHIK
jgi:hypothetical protein